MYRAKGAGRDSIRFFDPDLQQALENRARLEGELRQALRNRELELHFQVQIGNDLEAVGAEALLRWNHPDRGLMLPDDFMPIAEKCGLATPIGRWVLETACRYLRSWAADMDVPLAVNISASQFREADFVDQVRLALEVTGASPAALRLELNASLLLDHLDELIEKMGILKSLGIGFSIDNFGTGYTCLSSLKRLPLDQLKIDRCLIGGITTDSNDALVVRVIVTTAKQFGLQVIAAGIETQTQWILLRELACDAYQGFLFGRPLSAGELPVGLSAALARRTELNGPLPSR